MPMDTKRMNQKREAVKRTTGRGGGGDLWTIDEGEHKCFVHGQTYPDDDHELTRGYNFIEVVQHYGVGGKRGGRMCLDPTANPALLHPRVQEFLGKRKKPIKITEATRCPVCEGIRNGDIAGADAERQAGQTKWLFGITPLFFRASSEDEWAKAKLNPRVLISGISIFNQLTGKIIDLSPSDPTDMEEATLFKIVRTGKDFGNTEYEVDHDTPTVRNPIKLDKAQRRAIGDAVKPEGPCDLFRVLANLISSPTDLKAQMAGVAVDESEPEDDDDRKDCFGKDWADDSECRACGDNDECREATGGEAGDDSGDEPEEPAGDEPEESGGGDAQDDDDERPPCYGEYDADDTGCQKCELAGDCEVVTQDADAEQADMAGAPPSEDDDADSGSGDGADEEDPELAKIANEAERLASAKRGKSGKRGKGK